jgi:hypothetical protein
MPKGYLPLFNGKDFTGWEGNLKFFRIEKGVIVAGRLNEEIPRNEFLCTTRDYGDFELRLQVKDTPGNINGAIVVRSQRVPDEPEVRGYLIDSGQVSTEMILGFEGFLSEDVIREAGIGAQTMTNIWGALFDESRRNRMLAVGKQKGLNKAVETNDWNDLVIRCEGKRIQVWVNGFQTADYTEPDDTIEQTGIIGLKLHGGAEVEYHYGNIAIKELTTPMD